MRNRYIIHFNSLGFAGGVVAQVTHSGEHHPGLAALRERRHATLPAIVAKGTKVNLNRPEQL